VEWLKNDPARGFVFQEGGREKLRRRTIIQSLSWRGREGKMGALHHDGSSRFTSTDPWHSIFAFACTFFIVFRGFESYKDAWTPRDHRVLQELCCGQRTEEHSNIYC
jgi:hypothetical protein